MQIYNNLIKKKRVIYIKKFVKIYNSNNKKLVHKTHEIVKLEKYLILRAKKPLNLNVHEFCNNITFEAESS